MHRTVTLAYGFAAYLAFLAAFAYLVAFVGDLGPGRTLERGPSVEPGTAIAVDLLLLALLGLQQVWMVQPAFRRRWARWLPRPLERPTAVLATVLGLGLLFVLWRPLPFGVWSAEDPVARIALSTLFWTGWGLVVVATFLVDHRELFGLRQVLAHARGVWLPRSSSRPRSATAAARAPMTLGLLLACWAAPEMSAGRLLFAAGVTAYALIALQLEERQYLAGLGRPYGGGHPEPEGPPPAGRAAE